MIDLDELARLAKAATPGPWEPECDIEAHADVLSSYSVISDGTHERVAESISDVDAAYIAAADPTTVLAMAEELRLARAVVEWVRRMEEIQSPNSDLNEAMYAALAAYDDHVRGAK